MDLSITRKLKSIRYMNIAFLDGRIFADVRCGGWLLRGPATQPFS